jgi:uncharacterized protein YbjT (DUF2867 family)
MRDSRTSVQRILLTGATGYVGGRLLPTLEQPGRLVRCLARRPDYLRPRCSDATEIVPGDVFDAGSLERAMRDVHTAYYLVHALGGTRPFAEQDRLAAQTFAAVAAQAGVQKIIYLGGLGRGSSLSPHLASRQEVGAILGGGRVPVIEFRASIIIGSGSLSFEMVRALVHKLPVMITPRWVRTLAQPIAIEDVITYLTAALETEVRQSVVYEIGGSDVISYEGIMREYARMVGLKRLIIPVPLLSPWLSSLWLTFITPLYYKVGRHLIEGVCNETIVGNQQARLDFPVRPMGIRKALSLALENEDREYSRTHWSDALASTSHAKHWGGIRFGSRLIEPLQTEVPVPPEHVFSHIQCLGGAAGWHRYNFLWKLRGIVDQLIGGVGLRRGRRNPRCLMPGDVVDFWRVEAVEQGRMLRLAAEMKLPGRGWLQFDLDPVPGGTRITQTAIFDPVGLSGLAYWYGIYPLHCLVFRGLLRGIVGSERRTVAEGSTTNHQGHTKRKETKGS